MKPTPFLVTMCLLGWPLHESSTHAQSPATITTTYEATDSLPAALNSENESASLSLNQLSWKPTNFAVTVEPARQASSDADHFVRFPSPKPIGNEVVDQVCCEWYRAENASDTDTPAVLVLHESGSKMVVGRVIARELNRRGLHTFLLHMPGYGDRKTSEATTEDLIAVFTQGVADARRARDAIAALPGVEDDRIGLQGTSLGGFAASLTAGMDNGFHCVFLCLSGGDLHSVLTSGEREARKALEKLIAHGIQEHEIKERLAPVEPLALASRLNPETTWLYSAAFDRVVPPRNSDLLAQAIGLSDKHHIRMWATHYSGIIYLPGICDKIVRVLGEEADASKKANEDERNRR